MKLNENLFEYYSDYDDPHDFAYQIKEKLDEKVNDVFAQFQKEMGVKSGDIDPMMSLELDEAEKRLAEIIKMVIYNQMGYEPDEYPYDESLKESVNEDDAWSYEEVEKSLKDYTNNWKRQDGTARTYYKTEKEHIMDVLKKHYKVVEPSDGRRSEDEEMCWVVAYSDPIKEGAKD